MTAGTSPGGGISIVGITKTRELEIAMRQDETVQSLPASAPAAVATREEIDWEDRRWQLEWARRNIED